MQARLDVVDEARTLSDEELERLPARTPLV